LSHKHLKDFESHQQRVTLTLHSIVINL